MSNTPKGPGTKYAQLNTLISPEAKRQIQAVSKRRNVSMQSILRHALAAFLEADAILQEQEREGRKT